MGKQSDRSGRSRAARAAVGLCALALSLSLHPAAHAQGLGCTPDPSWPRPDGTAASQLLTAVNAHRATLNLPQLNLSSSLMRAAEWKAAYMAATGQFSHDDAGRTWDQRIVDCGYEHEASENIGFGYATAADMLAGWLLSPGHRTNIESPQFVATGLAAVRDGSGLIYWVQVFGTALDADDAGTLPGDPADPPEDGSPTDDPTDPPPDANTAPVAVDDVRRVRPGRRVKIMVLANDYDADGNALNLRGIVQEPRRGRATFDPTDGTIRYRARRGTAGRNDRLTYRIGDGHGGFAEAVVRIRIRR